LHQEDLEAGAVPVAREGDELTGKDVPRESEVGG